MAEFEIVAEARRWKKMKSEGEEAMLHGQKATAYRAAIAYVKATSPLRMP